MYLGLDFLVAPSAPGEPPKPWLIEVNVGLPRGAQEHETSLRWFESLPPFPEPSSDD